VCNINSYSHTELGFRDAETLSPASPGIANCNGCQRDYAQKLDADLAAWGTVQKVSNLILNINLYVEDERSGELMFVKSVDIRGNTDESWKRGLDYILRNYFFNFF
jgi:hypothetical protein